LVYVADWEFQVQLFSLPNHEGNPSPAVHLKTDLGGCDLVMPHGEGRCVETSGFIGYKRALRSGF